MEMERRIPPMNYLDNLIEITTVTSKLIAIDFNCILAFALMITVVDESELPR